MSIAVMLIVKNEERRIESTLRSFRWCDEIFVLDRSSSDSTVEIARRYTGKVFSLGSQDFSPWDGEKVIKEASSDWIFSVTASDIIHPGLAREIKRLTDVKDAAYNVIQLPFKRYVLGIEGPRSPWYCELNSGILFKKSIAEISRDSVHGAIYFKSPVYYKMPPSAIHSMYHLTHATVDALMDRHTFYCRSEAKLYPKEKSLWPLLVDTLRGVYVVLLKRRTLLLGWDGVALAMAYLSYWMLRFVYIWEARSKSGLVVYADIHADINKAWEEESLPK